MAQPNRVERSASNVVIGAGHVFVDRFDQDGASTGERLIGDCASATLSITTETTQIFSGSGATAVELANVVRQISRTLGVVTRDVSLENLGLFVIGDVVDVAAARTAVADETHRVFAGRWTQLAAGRLDPTVAVTASITNSSQASAGLTEITDSQATGHFIVDYDTGRIYFPEEGDSRRAADPGGTQGIPADGIAAMIDYTPAVEAGKRVETVTRQVVGSLRYLEDPAAGLGRNIHIPRATITAGGDLTLLDGRSSEQQITFSAAALEPLDGGPALLIDGAAA